MRLCRSDPTNTSDGDAVEAGASGKQTSLDPKGPKTGLSDRPFLLAEGAGLKRSTSPREVADIDHESDQVP